MGVGFPPQKGSGRPCFSLRQRNPMWRRDPYAAVILFVITRAAALKVLDVGCPPHRHADAPKSPGGFGADHASHGASTRAFECPSVLGCWGVRRGKRRCTCWIALMQPWMNPCSWSTRKWWKHFLKPSSSTLCVSQRRDHDSKWQDTHTQKHTHTYIYNYIYINNHIINIILVYTYMYTRERYLTDFHLRMGQKLGSKAQEHPKSISPFRKWLTWSPWSP